MPLPPVSPETDAYTRAVEDVRARVLAYALAAWAATGIDDAGATQLATRMAAAVAAAQVVVANLTAAFLARKTNTQPVLVNPSLITGTRGVDPLAVYQRPVVTTRSELARSVRRGDPVDLDAARRVGERRLDSLLTTDLQLAKTHQARESFEQSTTQFYRRVPRAQGACALCLIASTQRYKIHALMPIHPGCQCGVEPIPEGMNLDDNITDVDLLNATHAKVKEFTGIADRGGRAPDYRKLLITRQHGELGDVIAYRDYKFTSASDLGITPTKPVDLDRRTA